jgi:excisionase family DNA binding protein
MTRYLTAYEVGELLHVHVDSVRDYRREGLLQGVKVGKGYLFTDADIDEFIDARRTKPRLRVAGRRAS